jgi:hypothetical protein
MPWNAYRYEFTAYTQYEEFNDLYSGPPSRLWCGSDIETSLNLRLLSRECVKRPMPCTSLIQKRSHAAADPEAGVLLVECYVMSS